MIFSERQIKEIIDIINFQFVMFIGGNISTKVLSEEERQILDKYKVDWKTLKEGFTPFQQTFYFGRLASIIGPLETSKLTFNDITKYLRRGQYRPLSVVEKNTLDFLENRTYEHIKGLGEDVKTAVTGKIREKNLITGKLYEKTIGDSIKRATLERDSVQSIVSEIGHLTGDWERNLGRIAETEMQNAYEYGKLVSYNEKYGDEVLYYKEVYPGACQHCIKLYLTDGVGSEPILFTYDEMLVNGSNIGRKVQDWKAVIGTVHPHCRCDLRIFRKGDVWSPELGMYVLPEVKVKSEGEIKISVGDKQIVV